MNRYIDAELLLTDNTYEWFDDWGNYTSAGQAIVDAPTADVVEVVHGRWIDKGEYAVCTECGGRSGTQYEGVEPIPLMTQFCPNCGAKMDLEG